MTHYEFLQLHLVDKVLHGLKSGTSSRFALHVHGTWGNFYENLFVMRLVDTYINAGWSYATVNTSGHDGGSISENFAASLLEITSWLTQISPDVPVILQGHSLGALKIVRLLTDGQHQAIRDRVKAVVLLSPFDLVAFNGGIGKELASKREAAVLQRAMLGGSALISTDIFDRWPLSIDTYLKATESGGDWDLFPTRNSDSGRLADLGLPTLVALGSNDFASYPNPKVAASLASDLSNTKVLFVEGAPHNFAGAEDALVAGVQDFLSML